MKQDMETTLMEKSKSRKIDVPPGYIRTEVGVIPKDWKVLRLGSITYIRNQKVLENQVVTEIPKIELEHIGKGNGKLLDISAANNTNSIKYKFFNGDVLFGRLRSYLRKFWHATFNGICTTEIWPLVVDNKQAVSGFIFAIIQTEKFIKEASISYGTHMPRADWGILKNFKLPLAPIHEQRAIATALSDVDQLIESLDKLIAKKRAIKQATMQQLLSGKQRLPGFKGKWETKCLGEISEITGAGVDKKIKKEEQSVRLVNYLDVYNNNFITSDILNHWVTASNHKVKKCSVKKGDIFFTPSSEIQGDIGKSAVALEDIPDAAYSYHVVRVRLKEPLDIFFKTYAFKTDDFLNQAARQSEGSGTRYILNMSKFKQLTVLIPPFSEQTAIGKVLFDMDKEIQSLEQRRDKTKQIKQGMMQELLTGKTRLNLDFEGLKDGHDSKSGDQGNHKNHNSDKRNETSRTY